MVVEIREAKKRDLDAIKEMNWKFLHFYIANRFDALMAQRAKSRMWGRRFVDRTFRNNKWKYFVAEDNGKIIGFINGKIDSYPPIYSENKYGFLWVIYVEEQYRAKGVGKKLFKKFLVWLRTNNIKVIEATAAPKNMVPQRMFHAMGFREVEKRYRRII